MLDTYNYRTGYSSILCLLIRIKIFIPIRGGDVCRFHLQKPKNLKKTCEVKLSSMLYI